MDVRFPRCFCPCRLGGGRVCHVCEQVVVLRDRSLGIDIGRLRLFSLMRLSLLTGAAVAYVGVIAFVGLVGPHIARLLIGEDHRFFLPASALSGAVLMSLASVASKTAVPGVVLPIGLITSLIGVPIFMTLVLSRRGR